MEEGLPDKLYYRIGEVARRFALRPSVLRFWESEFEALRPHKSRTGQRLYAARDLELVAEIRRLLYAEKLTIEGARKRLANQRRSTQGDKVPGACCEKYRTILREVRDELQRLKDSLT